MEDKANTTDAPSSDAVTLPCWYDSVRIALLMTVSSVVLLCSVASVRQFSEDDRLNLLASAANVVKWSSALELVVRQEAAFLAAPHAAPMKPPVAAPERIDPVMLEHALLAASISSAAPAIITDGRSLSSALLYSPFFDFVRLAVRLARHCVSRSVVSLAGLPLESMPLLSPSTLLTNAQPERM